MLFLLAICPDGYARSDSWTYTRWAICASHDGTYPAFRYRNGGPRSLSRPSAAKEAPLWQRRAVNYVRSVGGLPLTELEYVVEWFRTHRTGVPMGYLVDDLAAK